MSSNEFECLSVPSQSYWLIPPNQPLFPELEEDIRVDVAIVGGGIAGISCAYRLSGEGLTVAVLESDRMLFGTTGHTTAKITSQHELIYDKIQRTMGHEKAQQYAFANEAAIHTIEETVKTLSIDCDFVHESAFVYTEQEANLEKIQREVEIATELGIHASFVKEIPFDIPILGAICFDGQARFHPRKYLLALIKAIEEKGAKLYEHTKAVDIEEEDTYVLTTEKGHRVRAEKVIIASHYPFYNKAGLYVARLYVERSYVIAIRASEKYPGGMYINVDEPARSLRNQETDKGELILVGGEHHKTGQSDTLQRYREVIRFAREHFKVEEIPYHWSTQDCMTLDGVPYIGHFTAETPNLYIATGFGKWGMTNATVSADLLTDLIVRGKSPYEEVYSPSRFNLVSIKQVVVENANVAKNLVGGKLAPLPKDVEIGLGEGKVIAVDGHRAGAFRDDEGNLHVVDTTCTHLGCELNWNAAEHSWDCPCHGSRFSIDGDVIEGPALMPLNVGKDVNTMGKMLGDDF